MKVTVITKVLMMLTRMCKLVRMVPVVMLLTRGYVLLDGRFILAMVIRRTMLSPFTAHTNRHNVVKLRPFTM